MSAPSISQKIPGKISHSVRVVMEDVDTWKLAARMLTEWREAKFAVSGGAECRKIARMEIVVKRVIEEICDEVERAEQESM